ncbi:MAG: hypothetical protein FJ399_04965, partial [Verrucomicrobia bacterium]|nr:hypothetical protein [Verrucomicrobiota bacterium]
MKTALEPRSFLVISEADVDNADGRRPNHCLVRREVPGLSLRWARIRRGGGVWWVAALFSATGATVASAQAQSPAAPDRSEVVEMSPFTVQDTQDVGYLASTTLAGSRLRTPLKDVAAQISVFTPELMSDLGLTNLEEALLYSTNADSYLEWSPGGDVGANRGVWQLDNTNVARG